MSDLAGNQEAYFQFEPLAPREDQDISIGVDLRLAEATNPDAPGDRSSYLSNDPLLDLSHPDVQSLASQLTGEDDEASVIGVLGWLEANRQAPASASEDGNTGFVGTRTREQAIDDIAVSTMLSGQGFNDDDALYLFIALTRAMKIPSRVIVGLETGENLKGVYTFDDLIIYSEILLDKKWQAVDLHDYEMVGTPAALTLKRLATMPARQELVQPYRLLFQSVGAEFVVGSEKYRFSTG